VIYFFQDKTFLLSYSINDKIYLFIHKVIKHFDTKK